MTAELRRNARRSFVAVAAAAFMAACPAGDVSFNRDVRPILSDKCFFCHGPDANERQAGLRLDVREAAVAELESGETAVVPGRPDESGLVARAASHDEAEQMPPPDAKLGRLSPEEVETLRRWIAEGAEYEAHWAFLPVEPPPLPPEPAALPANVRPRNGVDRIVFAGLAARGISPQPEADRATLIRRVTFDLTALPPAPGDVESFVADESPDAYERLVDRLLASPRYGERMTADWLDLARYADSYGFQVDRERDVWPWRDWVIRAFNAGLPWDEFVTWQLAGDLLPDPTDDQVLATAFNRLHQQEAEGGSVEEEYRVNYVNDRVATFGTAFLGLSLECARCHDHKFDPLTQREYYGLFAFFDDIDEAGLYSFFTDATPTPTMRLLDEGQKRRHAEAASAVAAAEAALGTVRSDRRAAFDAWLDSRPVAPPAITGELARFSFDSRNGAGGFDGGIEGATATSPGENELVEGQTGQAVRLTGDHAVTTNLGNFRRYEPFTVALWLKTPGLKDRAVVFHRSRAWTDAGSRGYELLIEDGRAKWSLIHFWPGNAASVRTAAPLPVGAWVHVAVTSDGSGRADGLGLFVNGEPAATEVVRDGLTKDVTGGGGDVIAIGERFRDRGFTNGVVDDFRVFGRTLSPVEVREAFSPGTIDSLAAKGPGALPSEERDALFDFYLATADEAFRSGLDGLRTARATMAALDDAAREIMVMRDLPQPKQAYVLRRGEYNLRGEPVEPVTPAALPAFPEGQPRSRLGLARWLTDPRHPLLARATVNRLWMSLFGRGLMKTAEDLGSQSEPPEYPALLDHLAAEFVASGWDVKGLLRTIVTSHVYRQRSDADPATTADDPANVRLARGPRHRLPAEAIRDGALASAGLLVERIGGPPVRTYDLPESFKPAEAGTGADLYRRSLYTFWRRTGPAPVLEAFDVPKRVVCVARRDVTDGPLHALVLLDAPQFVEAARVLAESLLRETAGARDAFLERAFLRLSGRVPDAAEREILARMYDEQRDWYGRHPGEAAAYLAVGDRPRDAAVPAAEAAAATAVINALMSYDGCVVKR